MKDFKITNLANFKGYSNKADITNIGDNFLVKGSQNVLFTDEGRIGPRQGYSLFGSANEDREPNISTYTWKTARGIEIAIRGRNDATNDGTLEIYTTELTDFIELVSGYGSGSFNFTTYWDTTESQDALIFVCGDSNLYYWSGGITTFLSATSNTITKQGTSSWSEEGFLTSGTRKVVIDGTEYTYTGGETTTTLTGVTPDPTGAGYTAGDNVLQAVRTQTNKPASNLNNDLIGTYQNQIYVGSLTRRDIYISAVGDYTDYTFSTPRFVGEGALLTLNETPTAMIEHKETMFISTKNQWYFVKFQLSDDIQDEHISIELYDGLIGGGAKNQASVVKTKQDIVYITNEGIIDSLSRINEYNIEDRNEPLSEPIKLELEGYDLTNCSATYFRNNIYFCFPVESKMLIYNIYKRFWEAPQVLPVGRGFVFENELYIHSNSINESYKLFDTTSDNGKAMEAKAVFPYLNYGLCYKKKNFTEYFTDGYIASNTKIKQKILFDYQGYTTIKEEEILGDDKTIIFGLEPSGNLGKSSLGHEPFGSTSKQIDYLKKFRVIKTGYKLNIYELQTEYSSNGIDQQWFILNHGANITLSTDDNFDIKQ